MATLTAGTSIKDGFLPGIDEPAEVGTGIFPDAADEEYRRDARYIIEDTRAMLLEKTITKEEFNKVMVWCRDREYVREVAENMREAEREFEYWNGLAKKHGITEEDVKEAIEEAKQEERERKGW